MPLTADYDLGPCSPMMTLTRSGSIRASRDGWMDALHATIRCECLLYIDQLMTMYLDVYDNHVHALYATMTELCTYDDGWMWWMLIL